MTHLSFDKEQYQAFCALERTGHIHMLNLVRLRAQAAYEDGRPATGAEAYAEYGRLTAPLLQKAGGSILWRGGMELMLIGPKEEAWDVCFVAAYPDAEAFLSMIKSDAYQAVVFHRQAAVEDSRLIRMAPSGRGDQFG